MRDPLRDPLHDPLRQPLRPEESDCFQFMESNGPESGPNPGPDDPGPLTMRMPKDPRPQRPDRQNPPEDDPAIEPDFSFDNSNFIVA